MKKVLGLAIVFMVLFYFSGCANIVRPVKQDQQVPNIKVVLIGKVSFEPELQQKVNGFNAPGSEKTGWLAFKKDGNAPFKSTFDAEVFIEAKWGKYFVVEFPLESQYLKDFRAILVTEGNYSESMDIFSSFPLEIKATDRVVYIGDLVYRFGVKNELGGKDNVLEVRNNSMEVLKLFGKYVRDAQGKYIEPVTRLLKGGKVDVQVIGQKITVCHY